MGSPTRKTGTTGTRADFYVGRGQNAEWLGSIAWDGHPGGVPEPLTRGPRAGYLDEAAYRGIVKEILANPEAGGTTPEQGWPWPWDDSNTTDYIYAFDNGQVWISCFGHGWHDNEASAHTASARDLNEKIAMPDMTDRANVQIGGKRSGTIIVG